MLVRDGVVVGEGWHSRAGGPHAEVVALEAAGERARGSTAYVTLDPSDHRGRTGPCSQALIAAGVRCFRTSRNRKKPGAIRRASIDPMLGLMPYQTRYLVGHFPEAARKGSADILTRLGERAR